MGVHTSPLEAFGGELVHERVERPDGEEVRPGLRKVGTTRTQNTATRRDQR